MDLVYFPKLYFSFVLFLICFSNLKLLWGNSEYNKMKKLDTKQLFLMNGMSYHKAQINLLVGNKVASVRKCNSIRVSCLQTIILL